MKISKIIPTRYIKLLFEISNSYLKVFDPFVGFVPVTVKTNNMKCKNKTYFANNVEWRISITDLLPHIFPRFLHQFQLYAIKSVIMRKGSVSIVGLQSYVISYRSIAILLKWQGSWLGWSDSWAQAGCRQVKGPLINMLSE